MIWLGLPNAFFAKRRSVVRLIMPVFLRLFFVAMDRSYAASSYLTRVEVPAMMAAMSNLWRLLRYGPALYRASRKLGSSRWHALNVAVWP